MNNGTKPFEETNMRVYKALALVMAILFLAACSSTGSQTASSSGTPGTPSEEERQAILEQQQALAAEQERQQEQARLEEQQRLAEQRAEEERLAREREEREAAEREAERQRQLAAQRAAERARIVEAQKARIEELRAKIAANESETGNLEAANAVLRQAVSKAEELTDALMAEEEKYDNTDPATGQPLEELATDRLQALADEVDDLNQQAENLMAQP
jgi:hypothetical protein